MRRARTPLTPIPLPPGEGGSLGTIKALNFATVAVYADLYITQPILPLLSREFGVAPATAGLTISIVVLMIALVSSTYGSLSDAGGAQARHGGELPAPRHPDAPLRGRVLVSHAPVVSRAPGAPHAGSDRGRGRLHRGLFQRGGPRPEGGRLDRRLGRGRADGTRPLRAHGRRERTGAFRSSSSASSRSIGRRGARAVAPRGQGLPGIRLGSAYRGMLVHFRNRRLIGAFVIGAGVFFSFIGVFTYLPYYLTAPPFHLSTALVSSVYLVYIAGVFTSLVSGRLSRRVGPADRSWPPASRSPPPGSWGRSCTRCRAIVALARRPLRRDVHRAIDRARLRRTPNALGVEGGGRRSLRDLLLRRARASARSLPGYAWQAWGWPGVAGSCVDGAGRRPRRGWRPVRVRSRRSSAREQR